MLLSLLFLTSQSNYPTSLFNKTIFGSKHRSIVKSEEVEQCDFSTYKDCSMVGDIGRYSTLTINKGQSLCFINYGRMVALLPNNLVTYDYKDLKVEKAIATSKACNRFVVSDTTIFKPIYHPLPPTDIPTEMTDVFVIKKEGSINLNADLNEKSVVSAIIANPDRSENTYKASGAGMYSSLTSESDANIEGEETIEGDAFYFAPIPAIPPGGRSRATKLTLDVNFKAKGTVKSGFEKVWKSRSDAVISLNDEDYDIGGGNSGSGLSTGAIVGIVVGSVAFIGVISGICVWFFVFRPRAVGA